MTIYEGMDKFPEAGESKTIVTICGSMKFETDMKYFADRLRELGYTVLTPVFGISGCQGIYDDIRDDFYKKIDACDILYVINKNGYIGESVFNEIKYAEDIGKRIEYLEIIDEVKPEVVTICGSGRFKEEILKLAEMMRNGERIVFTPEIFNFNESRLEHLTPEEHKHYDDLHRYKMQISDYVLIYDGTEGYIGTDTSEEITYAEFRGINVEYFSSCDDLQNQMDALNAITSKLLSM